MTECLACDLTAGRVDLPGGEIIRSDSWVVEHCIGPLGVGTLVLKPLRHLVGMWELTDQESVQLGPMMRLCAAATRALTEADQVFSSLWSFSGGEPGHIHFVLQPVHKSDRDRVGKSGPFIQTAMFDAGELPDRDEVKEFCDRAREWLRRRPAAELPVRLM